MAEPVSEIKPPRKDALTVLVSPAAERLPELQAMAREGRIVLLVWETPVDLILHEAAFRFTKELYHYLPVALKAARADRKRRLENAQATGG